MRGAGWAYPNAAESSGSMSSKFAMSAVVLATPTLFSGQAAVGSDFSSMTEGTRQVQGEARNMQAAAASNPVQSPSLMRPDRKVQKGAFDRVVITVVVTTLIR